MPRKGRGSKQSIETAPGQEHGERARQERAMRAVPLPALAPPAAPVPAPVPLGAPSERPDEPVTAGLSLGPGPGPEALPQLQGGADSILAELQGLYLAFPNEDLRRTIEIAERRMRPSQEGAI